MECTTPVRGWGHHLFTQTIDAQTAADLLEQMENKRQIPGSLLITRGRHPALGLLVVVQGLEGFILTSEHLFDSLEADQQPADLERPYPTSEAPEAAPGAPVSQGEAAHEKAPPTAFGGAEVEASFHEDRDDAGEVVNDLLTTPAG